MELLTLDAFAALLALTALEIVLGVDNIVVLTIIVAKLEAHKREVARRIGLLLAMLARIALLLTLGWVMQLTEPLFSVVGHPFSGRDLILLPGGLFLIMKATHEIHDMINHSPRRQQAAKQPVSFWMAISQIVIFDLVFSLDSVITAIGVAEQIPVMIAAIVIAIVITIGMAHSIGVFIEEHQTFKMLALSFLLMVGFVLMTDGLGRHIDKGYVYFAMGFSLLVEFLNLHLQRKRVLLAAPC